MFHIRALGDWTNRLFDFSAETRETEVYIDGPYGNSIVDIDGDKYKMFLMVSGGIGITPL